MARNYKLIVWHAIIAVLGWKFWAYASYLFDSPHPDFEPAGVLNFILFSAALAIGLMLFNQKRWALSFGAVSGLLYLGYFGFNPLNLLGAGILIGFTVFSRFNIAAELQERLKINSRVILRRGMMGIVLGMFVLISFAAYQSPLAKQIEKSERLPSQTETFIYKMVRSTIGSRIEAVNESQKEAISSQIANETSQEINTFLKPYFQYAPPLLAFTLFLILWGLSWIVVWLSVLLGMFIFWLLKKFKVVSIGERDIKAESLIV